MAIVQDYPLYECMFENCACNGVCNGKTTHSSQMQRYWICVVLLCTAGDSPAQCGWVTSLSDSSVVANVDANLSTFRRLGLAPFLRGLDCFWWRWGTRPSCAVPCGRIAPTGYVFFRKMQCKTCRGVFSKASRTSHLLVHSPQSLGHRWRHMSGLAIRQVPTSIIRDLQART